MISQTLNKCYQQRNDIQFADLDTWALHRMNFLVVRWQHMPVVEGFAVYEDRPQLVWVLNDVVM